MAKATKPITRASIAKKKKKKLNVSSEKKTSPEKKASLGKTTKLKKKKKKSSAEGGLTSPVDPIIEEAGSKRKLGLRGAAPWAARHAAKHAAEARARAAEPAPPGSARATIRVPTGAEEIKAKIGELHNQVQKVRTLRKNLDKRFYEIGLVLDEIQQAELHVAKGYGSFEAFLEREIDLGKQTSLKLIKIAHVFQQDAALDYGLDRLFAAIAALEGESSTARPSIPSSPGSKPLLPLKPPSMRIVG